MYAAPITRVMALKIVRATGSGSADPLLEPVDMCMGCGRLLGTDAERAAGLCNRCNRQATEEGLSLLEADELERMQADEMMYQ